MKLKCEYDIDSPAEPSCEECYQRGGDEECYQRGDCCQDLDAKTCEDFLPEGWQKGSYNYIHGRWYPRKRAKWVPM